MKAMDAVIRDLNRDLKQWPSFSQFQPARCSMKIQSTIINRAHAILLVGTRFCAPQGAHMPRQGASQLAGHLACHPMRERAGQQTNQITGHLIRRVTHALVERPDGQGTGHRTRHRPFRLRVTRRVNWPVIVQFSNQPPANPRLITQEKLAELVDLNIRTIQKIEAGKINVLVTTTMRIQKALDCAWVRLMS